MTYGEVAGLTARVAAAIGSAAADAEGRAISLDVAEALAVVALLGYSKCEWTSLSVYLCCGSLLSVVLG